MANTVVMRLVLPSPLRQQWQRASPDRARCGDVPLDGSATLAL